MCRLLPGCCCWAIGCAKGRPNKRHQRRRPHPGPLPQEREAEGDDNSRQWRYSQGKYEEGDRTRVTKGPALTPALSPRRGRRRRSEEHTSELQSPDHIVCRLLLEKKKKKTNN